MKIGYLRVSTEDQSYQRQLDGMQALCDEVHLETVSAVGKKRPVYKKVIRKLKRGDTFVVWDLDRAYRSTLEALQEADKLRSRGIDFQVVTLFMDTSTPEGEFFYTVMAAIGQLERRYLSKRTKEGMAAAKRRGKHVGRPYKLSPGTVSYAFWQIKSGKSSIMGMAQKLNCTRDTLSNALKRMNLPV